MPKSNLLNMVNEIKKEIKKEDMEENNPNPGGKMITSTIADDKVIDDPKLDIHGNRVNADGSLRPRFDINENPEVNRVGDKLTTTDSFVSSTPEMVDYSEYEDLPIEPSKKEDINAKI